MPKIERIKNRHLLKKKQQRIEIEKIESVIGTTVSLPDGARLEAGILDDGSRVMLLNGEILFFERDGRMLPTLRAVLAGYVSVPRVTVDMGAVRFVVNGADVMRPGVTAVDDGIEEGSVVAVVDERHGKPLAIGVAIFDSEAMRQAKSGKVVLSRHH
ncbi:MAG: PUA domain-containing protein, partial [Candidatus Thorarchaeota archaeon]